MTLLFPNARDLGKEIAILCPHCKAEHRTRYSVRRRTAEVCGRCHRVFRIEIFPGGTVLVE